MSEHDHEAIDKQGGASGIAARFFWMLIGNGVLAVSVAAIVQHKGKPFHAIDLVFWITVPILILIRYVDVRFLDGLTATGKPASMIHWRRYVVLLLACSVLAWVLAHGANYLFVDQ